MEISMVFGIIFAIIVICLILVFGMDQVVNMFCVTNTAQTQKAVKDLENLVNNVYQLGEGSSMPFSVKIPRNTKLCFLNYSNPAPMNNWAPDPELYQSIGYEISQKRYNMWILYDCGLGEPGYKVKYLSIHENFCVGTGTELYLENKGQYVAIERPAGI